MATSRGIDVSGYQSAQNWAEHKKNGVEFAFAKASEGMHGRDKMFDRHIADIMKAGLVPGAYHFAWPNQDVQAETANYIGAVKPYTDGPFMHWLDLERYEDGRNYRNRTAAEIQAWAAQWVAIVRKKFPNNFVGVYTSGSDIQAGRFPNGVQLWYPAYPVQGSSYERAESAGQPKPSGIKPLIWQFTSKPLDRSIAYVSAKELRAMAGNKKVDGGEKDEMQLGDQIKLSDWVVKKWPEDKNMADGQIGVGNAIAGAYSHARAAREEQAAELEALRKEVAGLKADLKTALQLLRNTPEPKPETKPAAKR